MYGNRAMVAARHSHRVLAVTISLLTGDCRDVLRTLPDASVQTVVTSPPYYGLRDYGVAGQLGLEATPDAYIATMVAVFREVRRVLRDDGTVWCNLGDSYNGYMANQRGTGLETKRQQARAYIEPGAGLRTSTAKNKDLLLMPARVALALQADGWWLRSDIIWAKPNPMPESCRDRPTSAHEHVFLLSKRSRYYYDAEAIREEGEGYGRGTGPGAYRGRSCRNVWTIATHPYSAAHFATFPPTLAERCIRAGSRPGDTILDPFSGAGTTALVADRLGRNAIGIDLSHAYVEMARERLMADCPLFADLSPPPAKRDAEDAAMADLFATLED